MLTYNTSVISTTPSDHSLEENLLNLFSVIISASLSDQIYRKRLMTYNSWHSLFNLEINLEKISYSISFLRRHHLR